MLTPKLSYCIMLAKGLTLKTEADFDPYTQSWQRRPEVGAHVLGLDTGWSCGTWYRRPARDAKRGRPCSLKRCREVRQPMKPQLERQSRLAGPQGADPSFGTDRQYVRGGGYSEAAQEAWLRRRRSLLLIKDPVFFVDDTYTVWRELFADKRMWNPKMVHVELVADTDDWTKQCA